MKPIRKLKAHLWIFKNDVGHTITATFDPEAKAIRFSKRYARKHKATTLSLTEAESLSRGQLKLI